MKVRSAVAGMELSTEFVVLILEVRWMKGDRMSGGSLTTRAAMLDHVSKLRDLHCIRKTYHLIA